MDTEEKRRHGHALRAAMANDGVSNGKLAATLGVTYGTITNWRCGATLPAEAVRAQLAGIFPGYDTEGAVEAALARSGLVEWRRSAVLAEYERHVYEQARVPQ